ncbi:hypothetical protein C5167_011619 [Papaver somniferum]|uniref:Uncharacterized protein n=1 Tax=Papaver somniferum TaxID=3469 RepID=A0A4Y7K7L7_PAPSO|nr:hypothetical protein C5167_011619 [Papaver somniferum]
MASSTKGPSIPVDDPDESMATVNPATVESISTATPSSLVEVSKPPKLWLVVPQCRLDAAEILQEIPDISITD